ncbi:MAG: FecR family protein [Gammaproteobacteria bacterium]|nr:FecR family protein [Gammaproteobacteria bacterium]
MKSNNLFTLLPVAFAASVMVAPAAYAAVAGHAQFVNGDVQISDSAGRARQLKKGDAVSEGDTLISAASATAQVRMQDGGFIALRPETQLKFDRFVFSGKQDGQEQSFFSLLKGGFRAVTGLIGQINKRNYRITTPVATVGIRGTDHETILIVPGSAMALLAPAGAYSKVNVGETTLTTDRGSINVLPNQMGFAGGLNQLPQVQALNTQVFTVAAAPTQKAKVAQSGETAEQAPSVVVALQDTAAAQQPAAPLRANAVIDAVAPPPGSIPNPVTPTPAPLAVAALLLAPPQLRPQVEPPTGLMPDGTKFNISAGTITTPNGQVIPVSESVVATQAQMAADAATLAANAAQAAAAAAQTTSAQLLALMPVDTTPAETAINAASPLVSGAAADVNGIALMAPAVTTGAATAVTTATTKVSAAAAAVTAANALLPVASAPLATAISGTSAQVATADALVLAANGLTAADLATATANASAAGAIASVAAIQTTNAASQFASHGVFADATAAPALAAAQAANSDLQTANSAVQTAPATVSSNNSNLTAAQAAAQSALATAQSSLLAANAALTTLSNQNAGLSAAQLAAQSALTTAQGSLANADASLSTASSQNAALTAAQSAAQSALTQAQSKLSSATTGLSQASANNLTLTNAQSAAQAQLAAALAAGAGAQAAANEAQSAAEQALILQAAGDLAGAQAQLQIAQNKLLLAQQKQSVASAAQVAVAASLASAQTAQTNALTQVSSAASAAAAAQLEANAATTQAALVPAAASSANTAVSSANSEATTAASAAGAASAKATLAQTAGAAASAAAADVGAKVSVADAQANTASLQATQAQTASADASAAISASVSSLASVNSNAASVAASTPVAAYNNPAVVGDFVAVAMFPVAVAGGFNEGLTPSTAPQSNTTYVLDGAGNLVEARKLPFQVQANPNGDVLGVPSIGTGGANLKWSGGVAADTFKLADNSIYGGRWAGATVTVTDNANSANTYAYTPVASLWAVLLPPPANYMPSLVGTSTYTLAASTTPVDAFGNLGILNSATLSANFTLQTVDAALKLTLASGPMAGTFNVAATALPIGPDGGFGVPSASFLTTSCVGTCAAGATGYSADLGGSFAGSLAASAGMSYNLWPSVMPYGPATDSIQGLLAFTTATAPTVNVAGPLAAYSATATAVAYTGAYGGGFNFMAAPGDVMPLANPTLFTEKYGNGNGSGYRTDQLVGASTATVSTTTPNGITFGVWDTVSSVNSSSQYVLAPNEHGSGSGMLPVYMYGQEGYLDFSVIYPGIQTGPLMGTFAYDLVASSSMDQNSWASGSVSTALLSADFTNQTVSLALAGQIGAKYWSLDSNNLPINFNFGITGARFHESAPLIKVDTFPISGATEFCVTCSGNINGAFTGQNYAGAMVHYSFWDNAPAEGMNVAGLLAFDRMLVSANPGVSNAAAAPTGTTLIANGWDIQESTDAITTGAAGVLTSWGGNGSSTLVTPAGSTVFAPVGSGSGTIQWGKWHEGSTVANSFSYTPGAGQFHWITAPEPTPVYLAEVLTATNAVYTFVAGDVTSLSSPIHGTFDATTSLTANFTAQTVAVYLDTTVNGHNWIASTASAPLHYLNNNTMSGFFADSYRSPAQAGYLSVTVDGAGANGSLAGQLVGAAMDGAMLKFNLQGQVTVPDINYEFVQGVAALQAAVANDPATPYRVVLTSISDPGTVVPKVMADGAYNNETQVVTDGAGNLTQFDHTSGGGGSETIQHESGSFSDRGSVMIAGEAFSWGRWDAGTLVNVIDRATGASHEVTLTGGAHTLWGPVMTGPVTLPTTVTYSYVLAGNTQPTDQAGVAGTLNTASLSANFTAQTVNVGVNVTAGGATLDAVATNVPIQQRASFFTDSRLSGPGALAVTCQSGACGTSNFGTLGGGFAGAGAAAAAITYGFEKTGANAGTVSGVAVFKR